MSYDASSRHRREHAHAGPLPLAIHRTVEMSFGMVLVLVPLLAALSTGVDVPAAGVVVSVAIGALVLTVAIAGTRDQSTIPPTTHALADRLLVLGLLVAAVVFASEGDAGMAIFFLVLGVVEAALSLVTRYEIADHDFDEPLRRPR